MTVADKCKSSVYRTEAPLCVKKVDDEINDGKKKYPRTMTEHKGMEQRHYSNTLLHGLCTN